MSNVPIVPSMAPTPVFESEMAAASPVDIPALPEEYVAEFASPMPVEDVTLPESGLTVDDAFERETLVLPSRVRATARR